MKKLLIILALACQQQIFAQPLDSLDRMIGQMIMVGIGNFNEPDSTQAIYKSIESGYVGGIIFFEKNISPDLPSEKLIQIIRLAQQKSPTPLFVSIDEEGGKVNRLASKYGFPKTVTAQYLGAKDSTELTAHYALQTAQTLKFLGFNLNYAPSVDLNVNPSNPIIGKIGRSYSADPHMVSKHAEIVVSAHDQMNVATAIKHFPGHGSSKTDTHLGITDVSNTWQIDELYPFKTLIDSGHARMVMTAHIVNRTLEPSKLPATLSYPIITGLLRNTLGFDGVVTSDDMQMRAISQHYGLEQSVKLCINAGVDMVMFCNNVPKSNDRPADKIHSIIKIAVLSGEISRERIEESYLRIIKLKQQIRLICD